MTRSHPASHTSEALPAPLKIQQLRYVLAIVDCGGFHAAAKTLHRTQPALSLGVKELESRLGEQLFEKQPAGQLTPFGQRCLPRFRELVGLHDRVARDVDDLAAQRAGQIEVATAPSIARRFMPRVLNAFISRYPAVNIELHDGPADWVAELVRTGEVDFGVSALWQPNEALTFEALVEDDVGVVCHHTHPLADANTLRWHDLQGYAMLRNGTSRLLLGTPAAKLLEESRFYMTEMISIVAMLETGMAYTTLPRMAFDSVHSSLRFIPLQQPQIARKLGIITRKGVSPSPAARSMMEQVRTALCAAPMPHAS